MNLKNFLEVNEIFESVFVEIETKPRNTIVGCIYRPPNSNLEKFNESMENILRNISLRKRDIYILGDFNINLLNSDTHSNTSDFIDMMFSTSFLPLINRPTRISDNSATLIDNIYTNHRFNSGTYMSGILPSDISDHFTIFHLIKTDKSIWQNTDHSTYKRIVNETTIEAFKNNLKCTNWDIFNESDDANNAYVKFMKIFTDLHDSTFPLKKTKPLKDTPKKPWITPGLLTSIKQKNYLYKKLKLNNDSSFRDCYKTFKNKLTTLLRVAEKNYYKKQLDYNKNNMAKTWNTLRTIINRKRTLHHKLTFNDDGKKISDNKHIAKLFNKYFLNAPKELIKKFPSQTKDPQSYLPERTNNSIYFTPVTEYEILKIMSTLNNSSPGHDNINIKMFKNVIDYIITPLTYICNLSIKNGTVPNDLKIAKVIPIHKKGAKDNFGNYRPISVLPALSKIFEKLIYNRLVCFLEKNNVLHEQQFGFRQNYSTSLAINALVNKFHESIECNNFMLGIFIDLSRAFDTLSHEILCNKLNHYGIRGIALEWIRDYLSNRKQYVIYNNVKSPIENVVMGVPQGSILGPLLFLLYVNDMSNVASNLSFIQYADDTSIFVKGSSLLSISNIMNNGMKQVNEWLKNNKLSLNVSKTNYMIMSGKGKNFNENDCEIMIDNYTLKCVDRIIFLGLILDNKFTWKYHIDHIYKKVCRTIGLITKARIILDIDSIVMLYNAIVKPYFIYCNIIWGNTFTTYLKKLEKLQKKILRVMTSSEYNSHTGPLFYKLKLMTIKDLYEYSSGIYIYKSVHRLLPTIFWNEFTLSKTNRYPNNLQHIYFSKKICELSVRYSGPKLWNALPDQIKCAKSLNSFKNQLKKYILCRPLSE